MKKLILLLLAFSLLCTGASAETFENGFYYTPGEGIELISYVALNEDNYVYNSLRDLTLMGIFRQERDFSLANYLTLPDCLKLLFRCAGLEEYAYSLGENMSRRTELGIDPSLPCYPTDGFFIAAYEKGLITHNRLMGYFENKPGCGIMHYAVRGEVIVWIAKLFGIEPSYDFTVLNRYGDPQFVAPAYKPYFAGAINSGAGLVVNGSYNACSLMKNGDLVSLLTRFYPYLLKANGIESRTSAVLDCTEGRVTLENGDVITFSQENPGLLVGPDYADNMFMLSGDIAKYKKLTYYIKNGKIIFVSTNIGKPAYTQSDSHTLSLYFYDDSTGKAVFKTEAGFEEYFLAENAEIVISGENVTPGKLTEFTDRSFTVETASVNEHSLKTIVKIKEM